MKPLEIAADYLARGWCPIPIPYRFKRPVLDGWETLRLTPDTLPLHFNGAAQNVGVNLGEASNGLVDIDMDCPEALELAPLLLPPSMSFGRTSKPASHWLYQSPGAITRKFDQPKHGDQPAQTLVELRATPRTNAGKNLGGSQTVFPGSTHKDSGEPIDWTEGCPCTPAALPCEDISARAARLAVACLIKRVAPELLPFFLSEPDRVPAGLQDPWATKAREWLGVVQPKRARVAPVSQRAFARYADAHAKFISDHPLGATKKGAPCPVPGCEGKNTFKGNDEHATCFHSSHPGACGTAGEGCIVFDSLDIAAFEAGCTLRELLEREHYLEEYHPEEPPPPLDCDMPPDAEPIRVPGTDLDEDPRAAERSTAAERRCENEQSFAPATSPTPTRSTVVRMADVIDLAKARFARRFSGEEKPMPLPWPGVAKALGGGMWPGAHVVTGTTAAGKTAFALQIAISAALDARPVLYIGLELDTDQIVARLASMAMGLTGTGTVNAHWSDIYLGKRDPRDAEEAIESLRNLPIYVEEAPPGGWSSRSMRKRVDELQIQHPGVAPLVVLDFLQLVGPTDAAGRREELRERIGAASYAGREVARKCGAVVLMLSSISRAGSSELGRKAKSSELGQGDPADLVGLGKESGDIEFSADSVLSLAREKRVEGSTGPISVWLALAKIRAGRPAWCLLRFNGSWFEEESDTHRAEQVEETRALAARTKAQYEADKAQATRNAVLEALRSGPMTSTALRGDVGGRCEVVSQAIKDLAESGAICRAAPGRGGAKQWALSATLSDPVPRLSQGCPDSPKSRPCPDPVPPPYVVGGGQGQGGVGVSASEGLLAVGADRDRVAPRLSPAERQALLDLPPSDEDARLQALCDRNAHEPDPESEAIRQQVLAESGQSTPEEDRDA